ncbi:MAG: permease prefix domain 1-containing protein [Bacteroidota bacterium]|nr:permease prefix domain 1-containing protein [Bacteroidota bacterium]MDP3433779.1 permease prefix domain 1-containing protein [Bacteroidota bacterium]
MPAFESERNIEFNLQDQINNWVSSLGSATESDSEELKSHLLDLIDELKEAGLDNEEAFWVASKRMGNCFEWEAVYREVNNPVIQMRRSLIILAGVLAYFLLYYFLLFSSKLLLIILLIFETDGQAAIRCVTLYLEAFHFIFILFALSIYFFENRTLAFIENIKLRPKHTVFLLVTAIAFCVIDTCLLPISKNMIRKGVSVEGQFYDVYFYFNYSFPLMICISFVVLYFKYFRKTKF